MESITHAVQNASNAIWSEVDAIRGHQTQQADQGAQQHGEEPISGVQGKGTATDPYDAGNREEQVLQNEPLSGAQGKGTVTDPYDAGNRAEQRAPKTTHNPTVTADPLSSTYERDNAALATSSLGPLNPTVNHPAPVSAPQKTPYNAGPATAGRSALKEEDDHDRIRSRGARSTLKDESVTHTWDIAADKPAAPPAPTEAAASTAENNISANAQRERDSEQRGQTGTSHDQGVSIFDRPTEQRDPYSTSRTQAATQGANTMNRPTEQRDLSSTAAPQNRTHSIADIDQAAKQPMRGQSTAQTDTPVTNKDQKGEFSPTTAGSSKPTGHKQPVSEETLKGPKVPPPRGSYDRDMKIEEGKMKKQEADKQIGGAKIGPPGMSTPPSSL
ncbi:hypothetical protein BJX61DRAFT_514077 [Aspergillus egyptiacus]|nr:hypothetical protein BJX61DRAFT_514077 [Aspergillus egyptiacus]